MSDTSEGVVERRRFFVSPGFSQIARRQWRIHSHLAERHAATRDDALAIANELARRHCADTGEPAAVLEHNTAGNWVTLAHYPVTEESAQVESPQVDTAVDQEGNFTLQTVVGLDVIYKGKWNVAGFVHARGEADAIQFVSVGDVFDTREQAIAAGVEKARRAARSLAPDDSIAKRQVAGARA